MNDVTNDGGKAASRSLLSLADDKVRAETDRLFSGNRDTPAGRSAAQRAGPANPLLSALASEQRGARPSHAAPLERTIKQDPPAAAPQPERTGTRYVKPERDRQRPSSVKAENRSGGDRDRFNDREPATPGNTGPDPDVSGFPESEPVEAPQHPQNEAGVQAWQPMFDPATVLAGVTRSKAIIVATTILGGVIGVGIALSTPKEYTATAELLVDPRDLKLVDRELTQTALPFDATLAIVENQVKILTSRSVLTKVVDELNLDRDPEFNGSFDSGVGQAFSLLKSIVSSQDSASNTRLRYALAADYLYDNLDVERGGKTFVVSVSMRTQNPDKSALIANKVIDVFLKTQGDFQNNTASRASDELNSRLAELRSGVEQAERKVEAFKSQNDLVDAQGRLITDDTIVRLNQQLSNAKAQTIALNAKAQSARSLNVGQIVAGSLPEQVNSGVLTELRSQHATLKQEANRLAVKLGPRHPRLSEVNAQLEGARQEIQAELRRVVSSIQVELKRAVQQEQALASQLAQLKAAQAGVSEELVTLRELEREASAKRAVYESFLLRAREADEQKNINTANVSLISEATPPLEPTGVSRKFIATTGAVLGFAAGIGIGILRGAVESFKRERQPMPRKPSSPSPRPGLFSRWKRHKSPAGPSGDLDSTSGQTKFVPSDETATATVTSTEKTNVDRAHVLRTDRPPTHPETQEDTAAMNSNSQFVPFPNVQMPAGQPPAADWQQPPAGPSASPVYMQAAAYPPAPVNGPQVAVQPVWQPPVQQPLAQPQAYVYPQPMPPQPVYSAPPPQPQPQPQPQPIAYPMPQAAVYAAPHMFYPVPQTCPGMAAAAAANGARPQAQNSNHPDDHRAEMTAVDEIRDSLREFRNAVRAFSQDRSGRG